MMQNIAMHPRHMDSLNLAFSDDEFALVSSYAHKAFGLHLPASKKDMVYARLIKRLRTLGLNDFGCYMRYVSSGQSQGECAEFLSALTTNVTQFFREKHHFDMLKTRVLPSLLRKARAGGKVRLWSAGCSAGQEAYSIALTLLEQYPDAGNLDIKILATDIDSQIITRAQTGAYPIQERVAIPADLQKYLDLPLNTAADFSFAPEVRNLISFAELNLIADWPMKGQFDVIFCRNVAIYFDAETQTRLWQRFADILPSNGYLFIGHSERVAGSASGAMNSVGVTAYCRTDTAP